VERKTSRRRGATLTVTGYQKLQAARRKAEESANFGDRYTKEELSRLTGLSLKTISKIFDGAPAILAQRSIPVDKQTLDLCFAAFNLSLDRCDYIYPDGMEMEEVIPAAMDLLTDIDWGEAPDISVFYGRREELTRLTTWVDEDRCKLVTILGMGGMGKTTLVTKLAEQLHPNFTTTIWRSLRNAPPLNTLIPELVQILSQQTATIPPTLDVSTQISHLLDYLRQQRCLLVFDNAEAIIPSQNTTHLHEDDRYPDYAELFERVGASAHQSCLLVTSREKPEAIVPLEGEKLPVRTLTISGLNTSESEALFDAKGLSAGTINRDRLQKMYSGNPLALNIVATSIADLFDGEIDRFLDTEVSIFSGIRQLLDRQFDRLAPTEQAVMYCLAIERSWCSLADLHERIIPTIAKSSLLSTLESLGRRSLIEHSRGKFTQQAVVMEYMTERTIDRVVRELINWDTQGARLSDVPLWFSYPLMAAESPKYIHGIQKRLVLGPIIDRLQSQFGHKLALVQHLQAIISSLQTHYQGVLNYGAGNLINLCRHLEIDLTGYNFANLPIWQVNFQNAILHNVNFSGADLTNSTFTYSAGGVYAIAFHPDSQMAAAGEYKGHIYLVNIATKKIHFKLQGHTNWIWSLAFSPDGQILASASQDGSIRLWDLAAGQVRHILQVDSYRVSSLCVSPTKVNLPSGEAYILATAHGDGAIRWWNISTGELISDRSRHAKAVYSVRFSPDGKFLASGSDDTTVKIWDRKTGDCLHTLTDHPKRVWAVRFSPDGQSLATCSGDGTIRLWDVATWNSFEVLTGYRNWFFAIDFSPDSQMLAVANVGNVVRVWNISTKQHLAILCKHTTWISTLHFSPNGKFLGTASGDGAVYLWDTSTWQEIYHWQGYSNLVESVAFDPTGTKLLTSSQDGILREWDAQTQKILQTFTAHQLCVWSIDYSPDSRSLADRSGSAKETLRERRIVSGSADSTVRLWDAETGELLQTFSAQSGDVWRVKFSPDGQFIAGVANDNTGVCLWRVTGELCGTFIGHTHLIRSIAFSPDGQILATASFDGCWRLWDVNTRQMLGCYPGHTNWIFDLTFSPDGRSIATCSADLTVRLWDVTTGNLLQTFGGYTLEILCIKFSPDGRYLATGGGNAGTERLSQPTIRIWEMGTGKIFQTLIGHTDRILALNYSPDGQLLVSSSGDETVKIWDLTTGECTATWKPLPPYSGLNITGATGLTPATISSLKSLGAIDNEERGGKL
jgi:WD40 repeat protein/ABC-type dipeptide/oligopeptide/nickel transport system ATPase subunit